MNLRTIPSAAVSPCSILGLALALVGCAGTPGEPQVQLGFAGQELSASVCPANVPAALTPAADQKLMATLAGVGVQIYTCAVKGSGYAWTFTAPQANLYDASSTLRGTHFAGPTWQALDGSSVKGAKVASAAAPIPGAIPWLLLTAVAHGGSGVTSYVTSIQRLSTTGGVAPATGCDATTVGATAQVPYTAQYYFYETTVGQTGNPRCGG